jgi:hypothetical protein
VRNTRVPSRKVLRFDLPERRGISTLGTSAILSPACSAETVSWVSISKPVAVKSIYGRYRR